MSTSPKEFLILIVPAAGTLNVSVCVALSASLLRSSARSGSARRIAISADIRIGLNIVFQTFRTSSSRATIAYSTGARKIDSSRRESSPPTITIANGFCESLPIPVEVAAGSRPMHATSAVIMMGRSRSSDAS